MNGAADAIAAARKKGALFPDVAGDLRPQTEDDGYAVQAAVHKALGAPLIGWKLGCTSKVMQDLLGIPVPTAGGMLTVLPDGATLAFADYAKPGVEGEIALRLGADVPPGTDYTADAVAPFVDAAMAAIEIVDNRYGDFKARTPGELIADDFFHVACILGDPVTDWRDLDLASVAGETARNGEALLSGTGAAAYGHPLNALAWLANTLSSQGRALTAGQVVLTGALAGVSWVENTPSGYDCSVEGLGRVSVSFS